MKNKSAFDTINYHGVGMRGEDVVFLGAPPIRLSRSQALVLAAWIVALADPTLEHMEFQNALQAVEAT